MNTDIAAAFLMVTPLPALERVPVPLAAALAESLLNITTSPLVAKSLGSELYRTTVMKDRAA